MLLQVKWGAIFHLWLRIKIPVGGNQNKCSYLQLRFRKLEYLLLLIHKVKFIHHRISYKCNFDDHGWQLTIVQNSVCLNVCIWHQSNAATEFLNFTPQSTKTSPPSVQYVQVFLWWWNMVHQSALPHQKVLPYTSSPQNPRSQPVTLGISENFL